MTKFNELATKKARVEHIRMMLGTNYNWAIRGLLRIYANQTADEQSSEATRYHNSVGFTGPDSKILSSFAKQVISGLTLSNKQTDLLYKKMPKYSSQLERMVTK